MFLLDTNVISEIRKRKPHGAVAAWFASCSDSEMRLAAVTIGEIQRGIERVKPQDMTKALEMEQWLGELMAVYQVIPMDGPLFQEWGRLMEGRQAHLSEDVMIAATARVHKLIVVSRNVKDFRGLGVEVLNPFGF